MLLIIITTLLAVCLALLIITVIRRERSIKVLEQCLKTTGKDTQTGKNKVSLPFIELKEQIDERNRAMEELLLRQDDSINRSERAGMRLSRNIEKAVISASQISIHTERNRQSAFNLFESVTEGSAAVEEIHASLGSFRKQNDRQNQSISETAASIESMNVSIQEVSGIASSRQERVSHLIKVTSEGSDKIQENEEVIRNIQKQVDDVLSLITVINDIASQTNLLSMNAAIEAAHAGEAGKGFAVVAEEIRSLAESTGQNALTISDTLNKLVEQINRAGTISRESGESFSEIENGAQTVSEAFQEIHKNTDSLLASSEQLSQATRDLQEIAAESTESVHEIELGSDDINKVLQDSKLIASTLRDDMKELTDESRISNYNLTKVSESYLKSNEAMMEIMELRSRYLGQKNDLENKLFISSLMVAHVNWMGMARSILDGKLDEKDVNIVDDKNCRLGQWIYSRGEAFIGDSVKFNKLKDLHSSLHDCIKEIVALKNSERFQEAETEFKKLTDYSKEIVQIIMTLGYADFISWSDDLSVKVDVFDQHHRKLLKLISTLYARMEEGAGNDVLAETLGELINYTKYHFAAEEKNFEAYDYPDKEAHRKQHNTLVKKANELYRGIQNNEGVLSIEVLDFLQNWVVNHIQKTDRQYGDFFKGKTIR
ncbi:MAG: bacteriohemerythrin [Spirochaetales bacterium]|nr:bacteriohemerythrin [Spirochaetales bacterium]